MSEKIFFSTPKDNRAKIAALMATQNEKYKSTADDDVFRQQWRESAERIEAENAAQLEAEQARFSELVETVQLDSADRAEIDRTTKATIGALIAKGVDYAETVRQAELMAREAEERRKHEKAANQLMNEQLRANRQGVTVSMNNSQSPESREMNAIFRRAAGRR